MNDMLRPLFGPEAGFAQFVREERQFCAILAHLLMQRGENLRELLALIRERQEGSDPPPIPAVETLPLEQAQIYLEFAYLRDLWNTLEFEEEESLEARNIKKRKLLTDLIRRVPGLALLDLANLPGDVGEFNATFMGERGQRVTQDIASPALWPVPALRRLAEQLERVPEGERKHVWLDLCKFKWAFRIKPDLVIVVPHMVPLCFEAKLMSPEARYPDNKVESALFDQAFGPKYRVGQIELQDFLFRTLLGTGAHHVLISQHGPSWRPHDAGGRQVPITVLSWSEVFGRLECSSSLPFVASLVNENRHIRATRPSGSPTGGGRGGAPRNFDGVANGLQAIRDLIAQRRQEQRRTEVGFEGGKEKLRGQTIESLRVRRWKWRDPATNLGVHQPRNWIDADEFESIVEWLDREESAD